VKTYGHLGIGLRYEVDTKSLGVDRAEDLHTRCVGHNDLNGQGRDPLTLHFIHASITGAWQPVPYPVGN